MLHYLKFTTFPLIALAVMHSMMQGGAWMYTGIAALVFVVALGDILLPDDRSEPRMEGEFFLNLMLWLTLPILMWVTLCFTWAVAPVDVLGIDAFMKSTFGYDRLQLQADTTWYQWFVGAVSDENSRELLVNFDFLPAGKTYTATIYQDASNADWEKNPEAYQIQKVSVDSQTKRTIKIAKGGGFAISIK